MLLVIGGCAAPAGPAITFDPCEPTTVAAPGATGDQLASLDDALAMWRAEGATLSRGDAGPVSIVFRDGASALYGLYDDATATVYINRDLAGSQRTITIAHELGHALALVHVPASDRASVMNPGNLTTAPDDGDRAALAAVWGECVTR